MHGVSVLLSCEHRIGSPYASPTPRPSLSLQNPFLGILLLSGPMPVLAWDVPHTQPVSRTGSTGQFMRGGRIAGHPVPRQDGTSRPGAGLPGSSWLEAFEQSAHIYMWKHEYG